MTMYIKCFVIYFKLLLLLSFSLAFLIMRDLFQTLIYNVLFMND